MIVQTVLLVARGGGRKIHVNSCTHLVLNLALTVFCVLCHIFKYFIFKFGNVKGLAGRRRKGSQGLTSAQWGASLTF